MNDTYPRPRVWWPSPNPMSTFFHLIRFAFDLAAKVTLENPIEKLSELAGQISQRSGLVLSAGPLIFGLGWTLAVLSFLHTCFAGVG